MGQTRTVEESHELQKLTARDFREQFPATESITFTNEGSVSGAGSWAANAIVTMAGKEYQEIIGPMELIGDPLPHPGTLSPVESMTVYYSNGYSEVLQ